MTGPAEAGLAAHDDKVGSGLLRGAENFFGGISEQHAKF